LTVFVHSRGLDVRWSSNAGLGALSADDGGPTAMGPSRRRRPPTSRARSPRGHYPPAISTHHSAVRDARGDWKAGGPARGDAGTPPPVSLAIGPLVARAASSAPRSSAVHAPSRARGFLEFLYRDATRVRGLRRAFAMRLWPGGRDAVRGTELRLDTTTRTNSDAKTRRSPCPGVASRNNNSRIPRWRDGARFELSGALTMPPGRREGQWRGTQAGGPPLLARRRPEPFRTALQATELATAMNRGSTGAEHVQWGGTAVARDPVPLALPSSADNAASPALSSQGEAICTR
jgi:hypothetical protein